MPAFYDQIFLFGDSITQQAYDQARGFAFAAELQNAYIRKLDVVNRGFSGYHTQHALKVLPHIIPSPDQSRIRLLVVFFGANDASLPEAENRQHIPLDEYTTNLETIVKHPLVQAHSPNVVLVAPPPVNEHLIWATDSGRGMKSISRKAAATKQYADAVVELGEKLKVPVVNLWRDFMAKTDFKRSEWKTGDALPGCLELPQNEALLELLHDGLHFSPAGYEILFQGLMKVIGEKWPELLPENLGEPLPLWNDAAGWEAWEQTQTHC